LKAGAGKLIIRNASVVVGQGVLAGRAVVCEGGVFAGVYPDSAFDFLGGAASAAGARAPGAGAPGAGASAGSVQVAGASAGGAAGVGALPGGSQTAGASAAGASAGGVTAAGASAADALAAGDLAAGALAAEDLAGALVLDAMGQYLVPGYLDLHIHGLRGRLIGDGPEALAAVAQALPAYGVTGFLPTLTPSPDECGALERLSRSLSRAQGAQNGENAAAGAFASTPAGALASVPANVLGFFLEGHFLALTGAISGVRPEYTMARARRLLEAAAPYAAIFGISPEIPGIQKLLPELTRGGVPAFITHTRASYEETAMAIELGARHATHFYDVFPYPGEKEPGVRGCGAVEALLAAPQASLDFILDGEHVEPGAVKMALACKRRGMVSLITDANVNAGLEPGAYSGIGGRQIIAEYAGGPAREYDQGKVGGLVGSGLTMDLAVRNAVRLLGLPLHEAVAMASANPARVLGLGRKGRVEKGCDADFSLLDEALNVSACFVGGRQAYARSPLPRQ
jgi:N-acetylglucosamine-6-phosphate deacetylase